MARISRKQLKEDRFAQEVGHSVEYVAHHRRKIIIWGAMAIALIVGVSGFLRYRHEQKTEARRAFQEAVNLFYGKIESAEPQFGVVTFATSIEKNNRTTEALKEVSEQYSGRREGAAAAYYLALFEIQQGKEEEAKSRLQSVADGKDEEVASLARLALADLLWRQGNTGEARTHYQYLVDHPTRLVPKERAQLKLAELLAETDPEQAKPLLEELRKQPAAISSQAGNILARLSSE